MSTLNPLPAKFLEAIESLRAANQASVAGGLLSYQVWRTPGKDPAIAVKQRSGRGQMLFGRMTDGNLSWTADDGCQEMLLQVPPDVAEALERSILVVYIDPVLNTPVSDAVVQLDSSNGQL